MIAVKVKTAGQPFPCTAKGRCVECDFVTGIYGLIGYVSASAQPVGRVVHVHDDGRADIELDPGVVQVPGCSVYLNSRTYASLQHAAVPNHVAQGVAAMSVASSVVQARRDGNGSLLCTKCGNPYPYAEPASDGSFVCRSCRVVM